MIRGAQTVLNIGLGEPGFNLRAMGYDLTFDQRLKKTLGALVEGFVDLPAPRVKLRKGLSEALLVVTFTGDVPDNRIHQFCEAVGQDAIAVYKDHGYLVGPCASHYEPFNISKFYME